MMDLTQLDLSYNHIRQSVNTFLLGPKRSVNLFTCPLETYLLIYLDKTDERGHNS